MASGEDVKPILKSKSISVAISDLQFHALSRTAVDKNGNGYFRSNSAQFGKSGYRFKVTSEQLQQLSELVNSTKFFGFKSWQGDFVPDGGEYRIWIRQGSREKSVRFSAVNNWEGKEGQQALKIWKMVQGWTKLKKGKSLN